MYNIVLGNTSFIVKLYMTLYFRVSHGNSKSERDVQARSDQARGGQDRLASCLGFGGGGVGGQR